ncbi:MAG: nitroreductase family deazaflavin-dependent oxidoreductase [Acidimicrobiia bacterium]
MAKTYEVTTGKRIISWVVARLAGMGVGNYVVLTTTGRKSGRPREVTLALISDDGTDYLVSPYGDSGWVLNARANPAATLRQGGSERPVRLVEVTGDKPGLVKEYYEREGFARQFMDVPGDAGEADFASVPERFPMFEIWDAG